MRHIFHSFLCHLLLLFFFFLIHMFIAYGHMIEEYGKWQQESFVFIHKETTKINVLKTYHFSQLNYIMRNGFYIPFLCFILLFMHVLDRDKDFLLSFQKLRELIRFCQLYEAKNFVEAQNFHKAPKKHEIQIFPKSQKREGKAKVLQSSKDQKFLKRA